jgi:hypothetical protein
VDLPTFGRPTMATEKVMEKFVSGLLAGSQ